MRMHGLSADEADAAPIACNCTDRRRTRCGCARTGRGHTLACTIARAA